VLPASLPAPACLPLPPPPAPGHAPVAGWPTLGCTCHDPKTTEHTQHKTKQKTTTHKTQEQNFPASPVACQDRDCRLQVVRLLADHVSDAVCVDFVLQGTAMAGRRGRQKRQSQRHLQGSTQAPWQAGPRRAVRVAMWLELAHGAQHDLLTLTMCTTGWGVMLPTCVRARLAMKFSLVLISCSYALGSCRACTCGCGSKHAAVEVECSTC
jgi:hypothetical protein